MKLFRIFILATLGAALVACGGADERKSVYLEKAKTSFESGDFDKARIELKNVLQIDPKDSRAYFQLGKVYEEMKDYRKSFSNYTKATELNPDYLEAQARLGRLYLLLANDLDKAQKKIDLILSKDVNNAEGLVLKAILLFKEGNKDQALDIVKSVVENAPDNVGAATFLATLYASREEYDKAINILESGLKRHQDNVQLSRLLAAIFVKDKQYKRAEVIYKNFVNSDPRSSAAYSDLAAFYVGIGDKDKAESVLRKSIKSAPDDINRQLTLIKFVKKIKGNDEAINVTQKLIADNKSMGQLRIALAELYVLGGDKDAAKDVYVKAVDDFPENDIGIESRVSLAVMFISDKNYSKANELVDEIIGVSPNNPRANYLKAKLALNDNDTEQAILALRIVNKEAPDNIDAYLLLANIYKSEGNVEQLRRTLSNAHEKNKKSPDALLKLVQYSLSVDVSLAEKIIDDYNALKDNDYAGLSIKAAILNKKNDFKKAYDIAMRLMEFYPEKANGYLQVVPYHHKNNDTEKVVSILEKGYVNTKHNRKILSLLTSVQTSDKRFDVVEKRLRDELKTSTNDNELRLLLAKTLISDGKVDAAKAELKSIVDGNSVLEEPYLLLARIYQDEARDKVIEDLLIKGKRNIPSSIKIPFLLANYYERKKQYEDALNTYREMYKKNPANLIVMNNLASILSDHSDSEADMELAKLLADKLVESGEPAFLDTAGWVYYKLGNYQAALEYLKKSVEKMPEVNIFNYHLGMAYKMTDDKTNAKVYLEKSLENSKGFKQEALAKSALKDL